jgi:hypothetical protein
MQPSDTIMIKGMIATMPKVKNDGTAIEKGTVFGSQALPIAEFLRMLAKIAHGAAVAELGSDAFDPVLIDIILGRSSYCGHYVGSPWSWRTRKSETLHGVRLEIRNGWLVAFVQLFARYHAPWYYVVVGKPKEPLARWSRGKLFSPGLVDDVFNGGAIKFSTNRLTQVHSLARMTRTSEPPH